MENADVKMTINSVKTDIILPGHSLDEILAKYLNSLVEGDIVAITSKIISICEGRIVDKNTISREELIKQEADKIVDATSTHGVVLTLKNNRIILSAGIDESNANGSYILYPSDVQLSAENIWQKLCDINNLKKLGVIITDSTTAIMRKGIVGITLGWCGFEPLYSYIGMNDIFTRKLKVSEVNLLDSLAASAVLMMGEGAEATPIAIIKNAPKINFVNRVPSAEEKKKINLTIEEDLYAPILQNIKWL